MRILVLSTILFASTLSLLLLTAHPSTLSSLFSSSLPTRDSIGLSTSSLVSSDTSKPSSLRIHVRKVKVDKSNPHPAAKRDWRPLVARTPASTTARRLTSSVPVGSPASAFAHSATAVLDDQVNELEVATTDNSTPMELSSAYANSSTAGRVHLIDYDDYMYSGMIGIGNPPQYFGCVFDTGSSDTWVFSSDFPQNQDRKPWIHYYNASASSTAVSLPPGQNSWSIQYGKGNAIGTVGQDTLWVGDIALKQTYMAFVTSTGSSNAFSHQNEPIDGIFGLGFAPLATNPRMAVIPHIYQQIGIPPIFSFHMGSDIGEDPPTTGGDEKSISDTDALAHPKSWFQLGEPDYSLLPRGVTWIPAEDADTTGRWIVEIDALAIDNSIVDNLCSGSSSSIGTTPKRCLAWVDTGSSFILMPAAHFDRVMNEIVASRADCSLIGKCGSSEEARVVCSLLLYEFLPIVTFRLGGVNFELTPEQYMLTDTDTVTQRSFFQVGFGCAMTSTTSNDEIWLLGDTFLKNFYTIYDMKNLRVGIGNTEPGYTVNVKIIAIISASTIILLGLAFYIVHKRLVKPVPLDEEGVSMVSAHASAAASAATTNQSREGHADAHEGTDGEEAPEATPSPGSVAAAAAAAASSSSSFKKSKTKRPGGGIKGLFAPKGYARVSDSTNVHGDIEMGRTASAMDADTDVKLSMEEPDGNFNDQSSAFADRERREAHEDSEMDDLEDM